MADHECTENEPGGLKYTWTRPKPARPAPRSGRNGVEKTRAGFLVQESGRTGWMTGEKGYNTP